MASTWEYWAAGLLAALGLGAYAMMSSKPADSGTTEPGPGPGADPSPDPGANLQARKATPAMREAFAQELADLGVVNFTADELTSAGGGKFLLPPLVQMPNLLKVAQLAQRIRTQWGRPLTISSAYRPWDKGGAHTRGAAIDFDLPRSYRSDETEHDFRLQVADRWNDERTVFAGMGFYSQPTGRVHVDVHHPGGAGHRYWSAEHVRPILRELKQGAALA